MDLGNTVLTSTSLLTEDKIAVSVGKSPTIFYLHKDLLCSRSDYFRAYFNGNFREIETGIITLPDDDVEAFKLLVDWIYGATLKKFAASELPSYLALMVLAEKLCMEALQNETMNQIRIFYRACRQEHPVSAWTIAYVYENTGTSCPLRYFIASLAAWTTMESTKRTFNDIAYGPLVEQGGDFAVDFASALAGVHSPARVLEDPRYVSSCFLHHHKTTPRCKGFNELDEATVRTLGGGGEICVTEWAPGSSC